MKVTEILALLYDSGHFRNPVNRNGQSWNVNRADLATISLRHPAVKEAVRSYQDFQAAILEPLSLKINNRPAIHDGDIGPATAKLFEVERCDCPDYYIPEREGFYVEQAMGSGSWPANCIAAWKDTHAITINVNKSGMAGFLQPVFETQVWPAVLFAYAEMGLMLVRADGDTRANLQTSFQPSVGGGGAIGLAIVPSNQTCSLSIWNRFKAGYQPRNVVSEWITLIKHELGHNMGLNHSRGGVMNPSIVEGLPVSWKTDTSASILRRWFGGEPVPNAPGGPDGPEMWVTQRLVSNRGRTLDFPLHPPMPTGVK